MERKKGTLILALTKLFNSSFRAAKWEITQVSRFTEEDYKSALNKLQRVALTFDSSGVMDGGARLKAMQCRMSPAEFGLQLCKSFDLSLTSAEVGRWQWIRLRS